MQSIANRSGAPTRREFLRYLGLGAGTLLVAACSQPAAAPAPTSAPAPASGATPAAGGGTTAGAKSNGNKLTVWGYQSFTPEGDKALGDQMQQWGSANNT